MEHSDIYGGFRPTLEQIKDTFARRIEDYTAAEYEKTGIRIYEHLIARVKSEDSMTEKCERKGLPTTPHSAMKELREAADHCEIIVAKDYWPIPNYSEILFYI